MVEEGSERRGTPLFANRRERSSWVVAAGIADRKGFRKPRPPLEMGRKVT